MRLDLGVAERYLSLVDEDSAAYQSVVAAMQLPKDTDAEKQSRRAAIQEAMHTATEVPLDTSMVSPGVPSIAGQLRGMLKDEFTLHGPRIDLHSGHYGNWEILGYVLAIEGYRFYERWKEKRRLEAERFQLSLKARKDAELPSLVSR